MTIKTNVIMRRTLLALIPLLLLPAITATAGGRAKPASSSGIPGGLSPERLEQLRAKFTPAGGAEAAPQSNINIQFPRPPFQMPFQCKQSWVATTYDGHYPDQDSLDLRRYSGDTNVSYGEPVFASAAGTISEVGSDWYGDWVYIDHGGGWQTYHVHINKLSSIVKGTTVVRGQKIGSVGKFANIEPHLHYTQVLFGQAMPSKFNQVGTAVHAGAKKPDGSYPTETITSANCPIGCTTKPASENPPGVSVTCAEGASVRVAVFCVDPETAEQYTKFGPWVGAAVASVAKCAPGDDFASASSYQIP